jgi:cell division protease FtsH
MHLPEDDTYLSGKSKLMASVDGLLGGRAAEEIIFDEVSTGAANDIQRATDIIRSMITVYGMSERFKNMTLGKSGQGYGSDGPELVREYSEATQQYIDEEIARVMSERYDHVLNLLREHKTLLEYIANTLLEKETMEAKEFNDIINAETHCKELENSAADDGETPKTDDSVVDSE